MFYVTSKPPTPARGARSQRPEECTSDPSPHIRNPLRHTDERLMRTAHEPADRPAPRHRPAAEARAAPIRCGNVELRPDEYQLLIDGRRVALTIREFEVLLMLAENEDRVVRRARIFEHVWGEKMKHRERAVDVFVRKLRIKLAKVAPSWVYIHTHFGVGYRFAPEERAAATHAREP